MGESIAVQSQSQPQDQQPWVTVLVDCVGTQTEYTYAIPSTLAVQPGDILNVPFGHQVVGAIALQLLSTPPSTVAIDQIRPIHSIIKQRFFAQPYWTLLEQVADYYQTPLIQVLKTALPPGLLGRSQRRVRLCPERIPTNAEELLPAPAQTLLNLLQQSSSGEFTWQYLQRRHAQSYRGLQPLLERGWAETYLATPHPPKAKLQQAVTVVSADISAVGLTPRQREILTTLRRQGGDLWLQDALALCRTTSPTLKRLATAGHLVIEPREVLRQDPGPTLVADRPKSLTADQARALATINQCDRAAELLLHGVTGSGKTEIYLQAIAPRLAAGQSALVLVPEIGLTPQLTDRFRQRFGAQVLVYHSGLSEGERYDTWRQTLGDHPLVVIGTRSAVFAPLSNLGLIVLDEEHDSSFKQESPAPCYHARTVARWRAALESCPLVLGSATPSLDTWIRCRGENLPSLSTPSVTLEQPSPALAPLTKLLPTYYLYLPQRIHARPLPPIQVVDMREELQAGNRSIFSRELFKALQQIKAAGQQGLLFIQRRGHSSFVSCRSCGHVLMCPHCDVSLSYHQPDQQATMTLRCHYCGYGEAHPRHCPACGSPYLKHFGSGTQRVVNALAEQLPALRCIRFDSDTTRTKGAHRHLLNRFAQGEADILVGTQMLTKGIDLPQVTLVGIVAADGLLYMNDYWASERALQMLTQVAGRAGRGQQPGRVILQTYTPEHPVVEAVQQHCYESFIQAEWEQRQALCYPPAGQLILIRLSSPDPQAVETVAHQTATWIQTHLPAHTYTLLGPAPAPILKVARRYRWQVLLKFPLGQVRPDLTALKKTCPARVSLTIDVDPLNLA